MIIPAVSGYTVLTSLPRVRFPFTIKTYGLDKIISQYPDIGISIDQGYVMETRTTSNLYMFHIVYGFYPPNLRLMLSFFASGTVSGWGLTPWVNVPARADIILGYFRYASITKDSYVAVQFLRDKIAVYFESSKLIEFSHNLQDLYTNFLRTYVYMTGGITGSPVLHFVEVEQLPDISSAVQLVPVIIGIGVVLSVVSMLLKLKV